MSNEDLLAPHVWPLSMRIKFNLLGGWTPLIMVTKAAEN